LEINARELRSQNERNGLMPRDYQNNNIFDHPQWGSNNNDDGREERRLRELEARRRGEIRLEAPTTFYNNPYEPPKEENKLQKAYNEAIQELDALDGMENVKEKIKETLALATTFKARERFSLKNTSHALHMVFTGNAGTGKTTVARIVGKLFVGAGLLKKGNFEPTRSSRGGMMSMDDSPRSKPKGEIPFVECSNADVSSAFWGEDEKNMKNKFFEANGGVLFMDEAYSMISRSGHRSGEKVMAVMVQEMENRRENVCVICAGYPNEMEEFMQYNTGLASRFATVINFENYDVPALLKIADTMTKDRDYVMSDEYKTALATRLDKERLHPHFGNARTVRNIIEESIRIHAKRVYDKYGSSPSREALITLTDKDIREFSAIFTGEKVDDPIMKMYEEAIKSGIVSDNKAKRKRLDSPRM
jgi:stage V sporulation protein K